MHKHNEIKEGGKCTVLILPARVVCLKKQCGLQFRTVPYEPACSLMMSALDPHVMHKTHGVHMYSQEMQTV